MAAVTGGRGVDLVLDPVGGPIREQSLTVLAPFGRLVAYGDLGRHEQWTASVWDLWKGNRTIAGFNIGDLARRAPGRIGDYLGEALRLLAAGRIRPGVTRTLPLAGEGTPPPGNRHRTRQNSSLAHLTPRQSARRGASLPGTIDDQRRCLAYAVLHLSKRAGRSRHGTPRAMPVGPVRLLSQRPARGPPNTAPATCTSGACRSSYAPTPPGTRPK
ncbi:zinc-binding dehydrogenase [Streptomyces mirabilis]|uniref:zinc-binding dehydrogenase n=1 Tax=Streptomyces mirabilis TaxID=68239 RepID=UPI0033A49556